LKLQQQLAKEAKKCHELSEQWHDQLQRMQTKLADTEQPVRILQQQLTEEANKSKALRDQLHRMEAELADTVRNREKLAGQLQKEACIKADQKINEDIRLAQEVQRRTSMAQRVVKRMLKGSFYALFLHIYMKPSLL